MAVPPLEAGAVQLTVTEVLPLVTVPMVGGAGNVVIGVTDVGRTPTGLRCRRR